MNRSTLYCKTKKEKTPIPKKTKTANTHEKSKKAYKSPLTKSVENIAIYNEERIANLYVFLIFIYLDFLTSRASRSALPTIIKLKVSNKIAIPGINAK